MVGEYGFDDSVKNHILNISYNDLRSNMINEKKEMYTILWITKNIYINTWILIILEKSKLLKINLWIV